jgi:hypothetical protein
MTGTTKQLVDQIKTARQWTNTLLADIAEPDWYTMPGGGVGHTLWQVGHLASSQIALVHSRCFGKDFAAHAPASYRDVFGKGSTPSADPRNYPSIKEVRDFSERIQRETLDLVSTMDEAALAEKTAGDAHPYFSTKAGAVAMVAMHETFHGGQIAQIRRVLGRKPLR